MALIAEELVEEWLNRDGYFTIRGLKIGVAEMDLLALKMTAKGAHCRHIEVQASVNPISYVCGLSKEIQEATGRKPFSAKERSAEEMRECVSCWIEKKFRHTRKRAVRQALCAAPWTEELVVHIVKHPKELDLIRASGIVVHRPDTIIKELVDPRPVKHTAAGTDLVNLLVKPAVDAATQLVRAHGS